MSSAMTVDDLLVEPLTVADRCDRCKAQAYTRWINDEVCPDLPLTYCNHHTTEHHDALVLAGFRMEVDDRALLTTPQETA
jgi:hypothetical protein